MTLKEKLLPFVEQQGLNFEDLSLMIGLNSNDLVEKIENGCLNVKEAYIITDILKLQKPADVFFS